MSRQHRYRMVMRKLLLTLLLGHLLIAGVDSDCVECLKCFTNVSCAVCTNSTGVCVNVTNSSTCKKEFQVWINSSKSNPVEGDTVNLTCGHNIPNVNLTFGWKKDGETIKSKNGSYLVFPKVLSLNSGLYNCSVTSTCGTFESSSLYLNVPNNSVIILVVCGVSALVLVLIMGLAMKFKLKRDNARHRQRRKDRERAGQSGGPAPFTPRES
ncbi:uncharacterized protein LOC113160642 [Anabas testudineus]|uniref:uncharacterized protein LOC113160642 n=1 Tax=Anabas testudineus TaxID=64144 RepID=UPI000E460DC2|nr:uncharacterized protein LOC113160642 [Anabas testudineus]